MEVKIEVDNKSLLYGGGRGRWGEGGLKGKGKVTDGNNELQLYSFN